MPWKEVTVMQEKQDFVLAAQKKEETMTALCHAYGISRKAGYQILRRYEQAGIAGLVPQSRRPHRTPFKTPPEVERVIIETRQLHPHWGGDKLRRYLLSQGQPTMPTEKTIDRILKRHGLITAEESEKHTPWKRFEHASPNDLWQMDFKGHFQVGASRCYPLTLLDDHSRFSLLIKACENQQKDTVKTALTQLFREYGLPKRMSMDNGSPWGYSREQKYTQLSAWLIRLGIKVSHSRPLHPQTQGKLERFHRTLKLELLNHYCFASLEESQEGFDAWRTIYNEQRPHAAIDLEVPATRYTKSKIPFPETYSPIEYDHSFTVRKVQKGGMIYLQGKIYRVGEAFCGEPVGLKESDTPGLLDVYYCHQKVVKIDPKYPSKF